MSHLTIKTHQIIWLAAIIAAISHNTATAQENNVRITTNTGTVNINFSKINESTKHQIISSTTSDELVRVANIEYTKGNFDISKNLFFAAKTINPKNFDATLGFYRSKIKDIKSDSDRRSTYESIINEASQTGAVEAPAQGNLEHQAVLYSLSETIYTDGAPEKIRAQVLYSNTMAGIERMAGNNVANIQATNNIREMADSKMSKGESIEAIQLYAANYAITRNTYPIEKILAYISNKYSQSPIKPQK